MYLNLGESLGVVWDLGWIGSCFFGGLFFVEAGFLFFIMEDEKFSISFL